MPKNKFNKDGSRSIRYRNQRIKLFEQAQPLVEIAGYTMQEAADELNMGCYYEELDLEQLERIIKIFKK